ncbi:MAG: hypothetical protein AB1489_33900 [Acidobacteriota bacterium]
MSTQAQSTVQVTLGPSAPYTFTTLVPGGGGPANLVLPNTTFTSNGMWYPSPNQEYVTILQTDGNLVLYQVIGTAPPLKQGVTFTGKALWATGTNNNQNDTFVVQNDGNLVVYNSKGSAIWASNTNGKVPVGLYLQNDGNLVLYQATPAWASGTNS